MLPKKMTSTNRPCYVLQLHTTQAKYCKTKGDITKAITGAFTKSNPSQMCRQVHQNVIVPSVFQLLVGNTSTSAREHFLHARILQNKLSPPLVFQHLLKPGIEGHSKIGKSQHDGLMVVKNSLIPVLHIIIDRKKDR